MFVSMQKTLGKEKRALIKALLDSGANKFVISSTQVQKLRVKREESTQFQTAAGTFSTVGHCSVDFVIPEISLTATINHKFHVHTGTLRN